MNNFYVGEAVPLTFRYLISNVPQTGQTVTVSCFDETSGATLLASTACPEVIAGQYTYNWTAAPKSRTNIRVTFSLGGKQFDTYYQILDDVIETRAT